MQKYALTLINAKLKLYTIYNGIIHIVYIIPDKIHFWTLQKKKKKTQVPLHSNPNRGNNVATSNDCTDFSVFTQSTGADFFCSPQYTAV